MTEKQKCSKCGNEATKSLILTKEGNIAETLALCDSCYQKEVSCQECGKEDEKEMPQEAEKNGQKVKVCRECRNSIELSQKIKALQEKILNEGHPELKTSMEFYKDGK